MISVKKKLKKQTYESIRVNPCSLLYINEGICWMYKLLSWHWFVTPLQKHSIQPSLLLWNKPKVEGRQRSHSGPSTLRLQWHCPFMQLFDNDPSGLQLQDSSAEPFFIWQSYGVLRVSSPSYPDSQISQLSPVVWSSQFWN